MSTILTLSGMTLDYLNPSTDSISIEDIAHGLALECRFTGQIPFHYSVAQHSIYVCSELRRMGEPIEIQLQGLLHDASEAYAKDIPKPLKNLLPGYAQIEEQLFKAIARKFDIPDELDPVVKRVDKALYRYERFTFSNDPCPTIPMIMPEYAESIFMDLYERLTATTLDWNAETALYLRILPQKNESN